MSRFFKVFAVLVVPSRAGSLVVSDVPAPYGGTEFWLRRRSFPIQQPSEHLFSGGG